MAAPSSEPSAAGLTLYYDETTPRCNWYVKQLYKHSINKSNLSIYTIFTCLYFKLTAAILACHSLPHLTFPYMVYDVTVLCMTSPLATLSACSQRPNPRTYSMLYISIPTDGIHLPPIFSSQMALLSLPLLPSPTLPNLYHTPTDHHGCQSPCD